MVSYQDSITYWKFIAKGRRRCNRQFVREMANLNNRSFRLQKKIMQKEVMSRESFRDIVVSKEVEETLSSVKEELKGSWLWSRCFG